VIRLPVGAVLLAAGALKAADPSLAVMAVGAYGLVPPKAALAVGFLLPGVEIAVGAALVTGFLVRGAALLAALLSATFLFVVGWAHFQSLDIACGCFGPLSPALESGPWTALLDVAMLVGSVVTAATASGRAEPASPGRMAP
jgi:uncharacterized membrane protein YphA (DoxX/SURF4 family)